MPVGFVDRDSRNSNWARRRSSSFGRRTDANMQAAKFARYGGVPAPAIPRRTIHPGSPTQGTLPTLGICPLQRY